MSEWEYKEKNGTERNGAKRNETIQNGTARYSLVFNRRNRWAKNRFSGMKKNGLKHCLISNISFVFSSSSFFCRCARARARALVLARSCSCSFSNFECRSAKALKTIGDISERGEQKKREIHAILEQQHFTLRTICVVLQKIGKGDRRKTTSAK